jgi:hypothetical protein
MAVNIAIVLLVLVLAGLAYVFKDKIFKKEKNPRVGGGKKADGEGGGGKKGEGEGGGGKQRVPDNAEQQAQQLIEQIAKNPIPVQLVLCLDTTSSMTPEIEKCKKNLINLVSRIETMASGGTGKKYIKLEVGFIEYKDHGDGNYLDKAVDFGKGNQAVLAAIKDCSASGGADAPEDMYGAFDKALGFNWSQDGRCMKVVCVIADAPCHGERFNGGAGDSHPGDGPKMEATIKKMVNKRISLLVSEVDKGATKAMVKEFKAMYKEAPDGEGQVQNVKKCKMGAACVSVDLNRKLNDEKFTGAIAEGIKNLFDLNLSPEMRKGLQDAMKKMR